MEGEAGKDEKNPLSKEVEKQEKMNQLKEGENRDPLQRMGK